MYYLVSISLVRKLEIFRQNANNNVYSLYILCIFGACFSHVMYVLLFLNNWECFRSRIKFFRSINNNNSSYKLTLNGLDGNINFNLFDTKFITILLKKLFINYLISMNNNRSRKERKKK